MTTNTTPARRTTARAAALLALLALAAADCRDSRRAGGPEHPNVLLLVMDTTRADRCSFQGYDRPTTPALAEFAKDAAVFTQTWASSNWTAPSHATLFTGVGSDRHGLAAGGRPFLRGYVPTLAERFAAAGYDTACFTNNEFVSPEFGLTRGFAKFAPLYRDQDQPPPPSRAAHALAAGWAEAAHEAGKPFFLFINDIEPHQPYTPLPQDAALFTRGSPSPAEISAASWFVPEFMMKYDLRLADVDERTLAIHSDLYDGELRTLDREVGVLLDRLRADGLLDSTVVVILSDHGEFLGEHHIVDHSYGLYRQVLHVPMVVRYPGSFDGGRVVPDVVRMEDVAPTLVELCGIEPLPDIEGVTLTRDLGGRIARAVQPQHDVLSQHAAEAMPRADVSLLSRGIRSVFDGRLHLLVFSDGTVELYDDDRDPAEKENLAAARTDDVARLKSLLTR
jgi:arylsulfatase A-like enzyme